MNKILSKRELVPKIFEMTVEAPRIARKALPGQFVVVMADETGERVPLTIADFDRDQGTITMVVMVVGASSRKLSLLNAGDDLYALIGPLGMASEIEPYDTVVMAAGGVRHCADLSDRSGFSRARQPSDYRSGGPIKRIAVLD